MYEKYILMYTCMCTAKTDTYCTSYFRLFWLRHISFSCSFSLTTKLIFALWVQALIFPLPWGILRSCFQRKKETVFGSIPNKTISGYLCKCNDLNCVHQPIFKMIHMKNHVKCMMRAFFNGKHNFLAVKANIFRQQ